ncbi:sodium-dependent glucose transporter 1 isoform X2 [Alosa sapidissima]|nr:sodium-dependent glucose transporter 1 isoform X2 [Alosa sapidissima]
MITLTLCASFLGLGMCISVLGPTLGDLANNVNKNISNISYIFVGRSVGYIGGSLLGGILFDCMNPHLLLGFSMLVTAFGMIAIPFCKKALFLTALMSCVGISMGFLDTGGNVLILNIWGSQAGPHMQALHFSFAAGAFVSPIIAKLVFGKDHAKAANDTVEASSPLADRVAQTLSSALHISQGPMYAYFVIGALILLISLAFFILYSCGTPSRDRSHSESGAPLVAKQHTTLVCLLAIFFFWYVGAEVAYGSFIFTYAKDYARMNQAEAAGLNSLFWGTFAATRGLAIFFAACMYPGTMILLNLVGCTLSSLLLTLFNTSSLALWSCTALYGASMATTFPSGLSWLEQYTAVTGRAAAVFVVGAALGEMVLPAVMGFLLGKPSLRQHPLLMLLALTTATITSILFPVMYKLAAAPTTPGKRPRVRGRESDDNEFRQALLDSGANDDDDYDDEEVAENDEEADHWNDADFEVIEMDDASLMNSPNKVVSPPDVTMSSAAAPSIDPFSLPTLSESPSKYETSSPRRKLLVTLDREKND